MGLQAAPGVPVRIDRNPQTGQTVGFGANPSLPGSPPTVHTPTGQPAQFSTATQQPWQARPAAKTPANWTAPAAPQPVQQAQAPRPGSQDMAPPTYLEDAFKQNQDWFKQESPASQYFNQIRGQFNFGGPSTADFGEYYNNAFRQGNEMIDSAAGARGNYKSSSAMDRNQELATNLSADRARNEADFAQRAYGQKLQEASTMGSLAGQAGDQDLSRMVNMLQAADRAQGAGRTRTQDYFNNVYGPSRDLMQMIFGGQTGAIEGDQDAFQSQLNLLLGKGSEKDKASDKNLNYLLSGASTLAPLLANNSGGAQAGVPRTQSMPYYNNDLAPLGS